MSEHKLVGAWRMLAWELTAADGTVHHPMGREVQGYLMYTPDGFFAANLMLPARPHFAADDIFAATDAELAAAARGYFAYCGRYSVAGNTLRHETHMSLTPNWVGGTQVRHIEWTAGQTPGKEGMALGSDPITMNGVTGRQRISWERA